MSYLPYFSISRITLPCLLMLGFWFGLSTVAVGQKGAIEAPENHVLDKADMFREKPEQLAELTESLKRIQEKHGYSVYLAVYYNVLESSVQVRADELYQDWLGDEKRGLIVVVQLDPAVDGKNTAASYYRTSGLDEGDGLQIIPDRAMEDLIASVLKSTRSESKGLYSATRVRAVIFGIEKEIDAYYAVEPNKWSDAENLKLMAIFFGTIALIVVIGAILWRYFTSAEVKSNHCHYFPEVEVAQRLGAPYGGGWVSEASFVPASSPRK